MVFAMKIVFGGLLRPAAVGTQSNGCLEGSHHGMRSMTSDRCQGFLGGGFGRLIATGAG